MVSVPASAQMKPILPPRPRVNFTQPKTGELQPYSLQMLEQIFQTINGLTPTVSCHATNVSNVYTLTPFNISPKVPGYFDYWSFAFVSPFTSTGAVTATVVPDNGVLATLPVYVSDGGTQANTGDIVINRFYLLYYVDSLNSGSGGFVLK